jgi:hypothetical protein
MDNAAFQDTDDAPAIAVLAAVRHCATSWEGSARLLGDVRASDIARACSEAITALTRVTGATDIVDEAACLIWSELCPDTVMGDEDRPYYEAAAKAVLALSRTEIIEECAKVCENLRHEDYPSETSEWSSGTFDCAQALRALRTGK